MQVYEAEQELYNLALESANDYAQKRIELQKSLYEDLIELEENRVAGMYATEEEYNKAREQLIKEYNDLFIAYEDQYNLAIEADGYLRVQIAERYNKQQLSDTIGFLDESTQNILETTTLQQETWITHFDNILEKTRGWRNDTNSEYDQSAIDASEWLTATQGYLTTCEESYKTWQTTVVEQNKYVQDALINTQEETDKLTTESDRLKIAIIGKDGNSGLVGAFDNELQRVRNLIIEYAIYDTTLEDIANKYNNLTNAIEEMILKAANLPECTYTCQDIIVRTTYDDTSYSGGNIYEPIKPIEIPTDELSKTETNISCYDTNDNNIDDAIQLWDSKKSKDRNVMYNLIKEVAAVGENDINPQRKQMIERLYPGAFDKAQAIVDEAIKNQITYEEMEIGGKIVNDILDKNGYNTGGYTGAWVPEGRLALLHEKEILQQGHSKEARQSGIKRYILLFTCQRPADTKTKQKQRRCPGSLSWKELLIGQHNLGANHGHARPPNLPTPAVPFKAGFSG